MSEEEIRSKVIYEWLKDCGFSDDNIRIEYSFKIYLGRSEKIVNPRSDVLVTNQHKQNLLIVEVKKPSHKIQFKDLKQALSYSRMLDNGIAPITIVTNGTDSIILDSVSGEEIKDFNSDHEIVKNGFVPSGDGIRARAEALEYLISLSSDNLISFCKGQVNFRMRLLKGDDAVSGKKYIPSLYVERENAWQQFKVKVEKDKGGEGRKLLLVVGPPQHGKTCFMCSSVEKLLSNGDPVLFYPAIGLTNGLISSIQEDFEWCFGEKLNASNWIKRLNGLGKTINKKIFIFIDGWNELLNDALRINNECERLETDYLRIIISTTAPSLNRLLIDSSSNVTFIADKIEVNKAIINRLSSEPLNDTSKYGIVQIGRFDSNEVDLAIKKYEANYVVQIPEDQNILRDPFYLRLACEQYKGKELPNNLNSVELIKKSIIAKASRKNIGQIELFKTLKSLGEIFYRKDRPISILTLPEDIKSESELLPWTESAILAKISNDDDYLIDFYYTHDLDFVISIILKDWPNFFYNQKQQGIYSELISSIKTGSGKSALRWFLGIKENSLITQNLFRAFYLNSNTDEQVKRILTDAILRQVIVNGQKYHWLKDYLGQLKINTNEFENINELPDLIFSYLKSMKEEKNSIQYRFWMRFLVKYDNDIDSIGITESFVYNLYGDELRSYDGYESDSALDTVLFKKLILDSDKTIARRAALFYAYSCQYSFLGNFKLFRKQLYELNHDWYTILYDSIVYIDAELGEQYYGSMCPGMLSHAESGDDSIKQEYEKMKLFLPPVAKAFPVFFDSFNSLLLSLRQIAFTDIEDDEEKIDIEFEDPNQLNINFKD